MVVATTFVDNAGITRVKSVPLDRLPQLAAWGVGASTSFDYFRFDDWLAAPPGGTAPVGDLRVLPDLRRLVPLTAQPGWAWAPADRYRQDGEPHERCSRLLLQRLVEGGTADGFEIKAAIEIEWVISAGDGDDFVSAAVGPGYGMSRLIGVSDYVRDVVDALSTQGIAVDQFHPEYAVGQLELSVAAESPVDAADTAVLVRSTIRAVGQRYDYRTSFSPKVEAEGVGNGGHVHLSVWRDGRNLMAGGDGPCGLTEVGEAFAAGILDRLPALLAIGAPSVASYLRLVPSHWAGVYACWGLDKIAFTGSTEVGQEIHARSPAPARSSRSSLGGKAANVIFDDASLLDQAVEGIINGIYFNQGHVRRAGSRLLVQESIYEPLIAKLKRRMATLRVGDPLDKNTDVGAINSKQQLERIQELVASGEEEGAAVYQPPCRLPEKGWFFPPTVFTSVAQSYRIAQEEIFGPVLSVLTFRTPDEAVEKANNTAYGLSAGGLDGEGVADPVDVAAPPRRRRLGEHLQPLRSRRRRSAATRSPASAARAACTASRRTRGSTSDEPLPVAKTYKLYVDGKFPPLGVGALVRDRGRERRARLPQGRPRRRPRRARRLPEVGRPDRVQPRPGALPDRRDYGGASRGVRRADRGRGRGRTRRSTAGSGTRAGPTSSRRCWARPTPSPARTSTSRSPSRWGSSA